MFDSPSCSTASQTLDIPRIQTQNCITPEHTCLVLFAVEHLFISELNKVYCNAYSWADLGQVPSLPWISASFWMSFGEGDCLPSFQRWRFPVSLTSLRSFSVSFSICHLTPCNGLHLTALENSLFFCKSLNKIKLHFTNKVEEKRGGEYDSYWAPTVSHTLTDPGSVNRGEPPGVVLLSDTSTFPSTSTTLPQPAYGCPSLICSSPPPPQVQFKFHEIRNFRPFSSLLCLIH